MTAVHRQSAKRPRATKAELEVRYDSIYEIVMANQPTGIRSTYYAFSRHLQHLKDPYKAVQQAILKMRRSGRIPYGWVQDSTRWRIKPDTHPSLRAALEDAAAAYRRALWFDAERLIEVWVESESVAGLVHSVTDRWDVPLYPCRGQSSDTFAFEAAMEYRHEQRPLSIIYIGDFNPHGFEIESQLHRKLIEFSGRHDFEWARLACTAEDVQSLGLTGVPPKADKRGRVKTTWKDALSGDRVPWDGPWVEVEEIPPPTLRAWLDSRIRIEVPGHRLRAHELAEESERHLGEFLFRQYDRIEAEWRNAG